jgi:transcription-repair coupling factor (superfamily II helicase)
MKTAEELREMQVELIDRFGLLPDATRNLMRMAALKQRAAALGIDKIDAAEAGGYLVFGDDSRIDPVELVQLVQNDNRSYRLQGSHRLSFRLDLEDVEARFKAVEQLIDKLAPPDGMEPAG